MAPGQIHDMDIVTDPGTVRGEIIIAKNLQFRQFADCHLGDVGYQVIRNTPRVLANPA